MARLDLVPLHDTLIGGKYRLGPVLGSGGVSTVYRATHLWTEREVAIKLLDPTLPHFDRVRDGFLREARATVQLKHPNVVDVLDMGEDDWETVYMVMELLQGPTLRDLLNERGRLSDKDALELLLPLLDALEKANQLGIVHRDFKPENIMLTIGDDGVMTPKLLDFGIAEILEDARTRSLSTADDVIMGTPQYMSPEQACDEREKIGPHTDVWGVGVVWYECLTGRVPFTGETVEDVLRAVCGAPIDFDPVPEAYVSLLRDALRQPPELRIRSFTELKSRIWDLGLAKFSAAPKPQVASLSLSRELDSAPAQGTLIGLPPSEPPTALFGEEEPIPLELAAAAEGSGERADNDREELPEALPLRSTRKATLAAVAAALLALVAAAWWAIAGRPEEPVPTAETVESPAPAEEAAEPSTETEVGEPTFAQALPSAPPGEEAAEDVRPETDSEPEPAEPTEPADTVGQNEVAPAPAAVQRPRRRARRKAATRAEGDSKSSSGSQYKRPPELVGEW